MVEKRRRFIKIMWLAWNSVNSYTKKSHPKDCIIKESGLWWRSHQKHIRWHNQCAESSQKEREVRERKTYELKKLRLSNASSIWVSEPCRDNNSWQPQNCKLDIKISIQNDRHILFFEDFET